MLQGKKILLGVSGGIAAYKCTYLVRHFIKAGAEVKVVLSPEARQFVSALSLATLSKQPVLWEYYDPQDLSGQWNNHVSLGLWADLMLIAPATSNSLAKMAHAQADNFLLGVYLSAKCPIYIAPAMDLDMYQHPGNQANLKQLASFPQHHIIPAEHGELASGLEGQGRMAEPETIVNFIEKELRSTQILAGKRVLINAGPTYEAIDPVRFLGNRSSGKMGIALAEAAYAKGAQVDLVLGPTHLRPTSKGIALHMVESSAQMLDACAQIFPHCDAAILAAAVSDYRPAQRALEKLKKIGSAGMQLELVQNPDILKTLGSLKKAHQILVGFALETENARENAERKLHTKNCDWIVLNEADQEGLVFGSDSNQVLLIGAQGQSLALGRKNKTALAHEILAHIF